MELHDFILVGSGCTGAMAAQTLLEKGAKVLLLDGGFRDTHYDAITPSENFTALRTSDPGQHLYLLGEQFESLPEGEVKTGEQLSPGRKYLVEGVEKFLAMHSETFFPMESLAYGGLGGGWGLGCCVFSENELRQAALPVNAMQRAYQVVADRIGISGTADDAQPYTFAHLHNIQPSVTMHPVTAHLLKRYARNRSKLNASGFHLGRPALALLTQDKGERKATAYRDMEFYDDKGGSAWRAWMTMDELKKNPRLQYIGNSLVLQFSEAAEVVTVDVLDLQTNERKTYFTRKLILAPGPLGTGRIVLRSLGRAKQLPLLCNPYTYVPCVVPAQVGRAVPPALCGMAQLSLFYDADGTNSRVAMASLYTYRSLLLFRLIREVPLGFNEARRLMQYLQSGILIAGIHHPENAGSDKFLRLDPDGETPTGDRLFAHYKRSAAEMQEQTRTEKAYIRALRKTGAYALKKLDPGMGSSIHYAGVLPFSETEKPFALSPSGRLYGTANVYVADGSGFAFLPAKGLTLSLMANAHLVAEHLGA